MATGDSGEGSRPAGAEGCLEEGAGERRGGLRRSCHRPEQPSWMPGRPRRTRSPEGIRVQTGKPRDPTCILRSNRQTHKLAPRTGHVTRRGKQAGLVPSDPSYFPADVEAGIHDSPTQIAAAWPAGAPPPSTHLASTGQPALARPEWGLRVDRDQTTPYIGGDSSRWERPSWVHTHTHGLRFQCHCTYGGRDTMSPPRAAPQGGDKGGT